MTRVQTDLDGLAPVFRSNLEAWLEEVTLAVPHVEFRVTETRRDAERQGWLYAQGRDEPYKRAPQVTWTMDSRHRWGLAADVAMIRRATREAIWEVSSWVWVYRQVPPEAFGLRHLGPREWVHLEAFYADDMIANADVHGLVQT